MGNFKVGDKVKIIKATSGAYGANGRTGIIIEKPQDFKNCNGIERYKNGVWVELMDNGQIWNIGTKAKLELISRPQQTEEMQMEKGNFKIRCIGNETSLLTKGKVYEFVNGCTHWDNNKHSVKYKSFEEFVNYNPSFSQKFELVQEIPQYIIINQQNQTVTATLKQGKEVVKTAKAKCSPDDKFEFEVGAKLAVERLFEMEVKEVKRPAKVKEWVKIVNAMPEAFYGQVYANGDCFKVISTNACGEFDITVKGVRSFIDRDEYVVLENYQPPTQPEIDYFEIDYAKLDTKKMLVEIERRIK